MESVAFIILGIGYGRPNGWQSLRRSAPPPLRCHLVFLSLRTGKIELSNGEAVGIITPLLISSYIKDITLEGPVVTYTGPYYLC